MTRADYNAYMRSWRKRWVIKPGNREIWRDYHQLQDLAFPDRRRNEYLRHRRQRLEKQKRYAEQHREEKAKYDKDNSSKTKDARSMYSILSHLAFPGRRLARRALRRAGRHLLSKSERHQINRIYERRVELRKYFDVVVDHIIPLARGGTHTASNLQIIYSYENLKKRCSLTYKPTIVFS